jgi:hypothetical protein
MSLDKDTKDEIRELIQEEIYKAFNTAFAAALSYPISITQSHDPDYRDARQKRSEIIREVGNGIKSALDDLRTEAQAKVVEKTDPARAERIRNLKPTF